MPRHYGNRVFGECSPFDVANFEDEREDLDLDVLQPEQVHHCDYYDEEEVGNEVFYEERGGKPDLSKPLIGAEGEGKTYTLESLGFADTIEKVAHVAAPKEKKGPKPNMSKKGKKPQNKKGTKMHQVTVEEPTAVSKCKQPPVIPECEVEVVCPKKDRTKKPQTNKKATQPKFTQSELLQKLADNRQNVNKKKRRPKKGVHQEVAEKCPDEPKEVVEKCPIEPQEVAEKCPIEPQEVVEKCPIEPQEVAEKCPIEPQEVAEKCLEEHKEVVEKCPIEPLEVAEECPIEPQEVAEKCPDEPQEVDDHPNIKDETNVVLAPTATQEDAPEGDGGKRRYLPWLFAVLDGIAVIMVLLFCFVMLTFLLPYDAEVSECQEQAQAENIKYVEYLRQVAELNTWLEYRPTEFYNVTLKEVPMPRTCMPCLWH